MLQQWYNALYAVIAFFLAVLLFPIFLLSKRGRHRLYERYGIWLNDSDAQSYIWFHGASLGEVKGIGQFLEGFRESYPEVKFLLTYLSNYGAPNKGSPFHESHVLPFDSLLFYLFALRGRLKKIEAFILCETELWPGLLYLLHLLHIPVIVVNGRISDLSIRRYLFLRWFFEPLLKRIALGCIADQVSLERFSTLGVPASKLFLSGNTKYDSPPRIQSSNEALTLEEKFFTVTRPTVVLGSVRPGEEEFWFPILREFATELNIIVAPRHREKFTYFAEKLAAYEIPFVRYTELTASTESVVLLDTFGLLDKVYSFASVAFIGASMVPIGGHNPLEAAIYGVVPIMGRHHFVVRDVVSDLMQRDAISIVENSSEIREIILQLLKDSEAVRKRGERAKEVAMQHQGAATRAMPLILKALNDAP